jgi:hypothetical protein
MKTIHQFINLALGLALLGIITACSSQNEAAAEPVATTPTPSPYRKLLDSEIRGIDDKTIEEYLTGKGMGLALPAELNGYPGPRHVIDLADDLELSPEQLTLIQALFDEMQPQAIALGEEILVAEAALEEDFRQQKIDETSLESQLQTIATLQARLRFVHLSTHLATIDILSLHQVTLYNSLRGYSDVPADHNQHQHGSG